MIVSPLQRITPLQKTTSVSSVNNSIPTSPAAFSISPMIPEGPAVFQILVVDLQMHLHTKFGIPTSMNTRDMHHMQCGFKKLGQGHSDPSMVCDTSSPQDTSTHQIWDSYLYAPDTIFLKTRSEVKVTVTLKWYGPLHHRIHTPNMGFVPQRIYAPDMKRD